MCEGETREIEDADLVADLLRAGYIEGVKPTKEIEDADLVADVLDAVDGEEVYFSPNPALGLWIDRERFEKED